MKNKTKKPTLRRDYLESVAEQIRDNVKIIGEGYKALDEKLDRNFAGLSNDLIKFQNETRSNFKTVFDYLSRIDDELKDIRIEMKKMREELKSKTDLVRFEILESRVLKIEEELAHRRLLWISCFFFCLW